MSKIILLFCALFIGLTLSIGLIAQAQGTVNKTVAPLSPNTSSQISAGTIGSAKCGVNTFSIGNECGVGVYKNMYFECYDGYTEKMGGDSSCKSSETWQEYARAICVKRCSTNTQTVPPVTPVPSTTGVKPSGGATDIPVSKPTITIAPTAVSICVSNGSLMSEYNNLLEDLKNADLQTDTQKVEIIKNKITSLKNEIRQNCTVTAINTVSPQTTAVTKPINQCATLNQWQEKILYYEKMTGLSEEDLKKTNSFSIEEAKKILTDLREKYGELKGRCNSVTGTSQAVLPTVVGQGSVSSEPINPISATSGKEIDTYYKAKIGTIINSKDTTSQIQQLKTLRTEIDGLVENLIKSRKEVEATEFGGLVKQIDINPGEIKADDVTVSTNDKKIFIGLGDKPVSVEPTAGQVTIKDKDINVGVTSGGVSIKDNVLTVGNVTVNFAPSSITEKLNIIPRTVTLQEENGKAIYEIKTNEMRKLFGLISVNLSKTVTADAGSGNLLTEKLPWYSFITTKR